MRVNKDPHLAEEIFQESDWNESSGAKHPIFEVIYILVGEKAKRRMEEKKQSEVKASSQQLEIKGKVQDVRVSFLDGIEIPKENKYHQADKETNWLAGL
jgi:hypothetical protein